MPGYYFAKDRNQWTARIKINNEVLRLGQFQTEKEAALAYDYAAKKLNRTDLNYPGESIPKAIREVVKPKLEKFDLAKKVEAAVAKVDEKIWNEGETEGSIWISFRSAKDYEHILDITQDSIAMEEPTVIADMIGCGDDFVEIVTGRTRRDRQPIKSKISQLAFIRGFLIGAQRYIRDCKEDRERQSRRDEQVRKVLAEQRAKAACADAPEPQPASLAGNQSPTAQEATGDVPEAIQASRMHFSQLLAELQAKAAANKAKTQEEIDDELACVDIGAQVPGTTIGPNGEVWSADCNPETLARDNAAIAEAQRNRTGIFAMMDAVDAENAKKREIDELLAGIV